MPITRSVKPPATSVDRYRPSSAASVVRVPSGSSMPRTPCPARRGRRSPAPRPSQPSAPGAPRVPAHSPAPYTVDRCGPPLVPVRRPPRSRNGAARPGARPDRHTRPRRRQARELGRTGAADGDPRTSRRARRAIPRWRRGSATRDAPLWSSHLRTAGVVTPSGGTARCHRSRRAPASPPRVQWPGRRGDVECQLTDDRPAVDPADRGEIGLPAQHMPAGVPPPGRTPSSTIYQEPSGA